MRFESNIRKRGAVPETTLKKGKDYPVGPLLLGFFVFVVIGSCKTNPFYYLYNLRYYIVSELCLFNSSLPDNQDSNRWRHGLM